MRVEVDDSDSKRHDKDPAILINTFQAVRYLKSGKLLIHSAHGSLPIHQLMHSLGANAAVNVSMELNLGQSYAKVDKICSGSHEEKLRRLGKLVGRCIQVVAAEQTSSPFAEVIMSTLNGFQVQHAE